MKTTRQIIAVDIDDVLSAHAEAFIAYSNTVYGTNLTVNDYHEHWSRLWGVDYEEVEKRVKAYHASGALSSYKPHIEAEPVLRKLAKNHKLLVVTARKSITAKDTEAWIEKHYSGIFNAVHHAGMWDTVTEHSITATKAELCQKLGADYLIDDQLKHCLASAKLGVKAIIFGNYPWNRMVDLPEMVVRCDDWLAVQEYFYE